MSNAKTGCVWDNGDTEWEAMTYGSWDEADADVAGLAEKGGCSYAYSYTVFGNAFRWGRGVSAEDRGYLLGAQADRAASAQAAYDNPATHGTDEEKQIERSLRWAALCNITYLWKAMGGE